MADEQLDVEPWYRQFWPWYIIGLLFLGVFGSGVLVFSAIDHQDPLVVDDYYKEGLAINRTLDRQRMAKKMGLQAQAHYDAADGVLSIQLKTRHDVTSPKLELRFFHATLANQDYAVTLKREGTDIYRAKLKTLKAGNWDLMLEPEDKVWRLDAHLSLPAKNWKLMPEL